MADVQRDPTTNVDQALGTFKTPVRVSPQEVPPREKTTTINAADNNAAKADVARVANPNKVKTPLTPVAKVGDRGTLLINDPGAPTGQRTLAAVVASVNDDNTLNLSATNFNGATFGQVGVPFSATAALGKFTPAT